MLIEPQRLRWDLFISHASEDKDDVARPLAQLLCNAGLQVWLDENELRLGDSLRAKVDQGLAESRHGIVILSRAFFAKDWPQRELNGLASRDSNDLRIILPVWHGVDHAFVARQSPTLADKIAVNTDQGIDQVAQHIIRAVTAPLGDATARKMAADIEPQPTTAPEVIIRQRQTETITVSILFATSGVRNTCEIPLDVSVERLLPALTKKLGLPMVHPLDGRALKAFLFSTRQARQLDSRLTVRENNVQEHEILNIGWEMIAG
jgi:hypothetical protein